LPPGAIAECTPRQHVTRICGKMLLFSVWVFAVEAISRTLLSSGSYLSVLNFRFLTSGSKAAASPRVFDVAARRLRANLAQKLSSCPIRAEKEGSDDEQIALTFPLWLGAS